MFMNRNTTIGMVIVVLVLLVGGFLFINSRNSTSENMTPTDSMDHTSDSMSSPIGSSSPESSGAALQSSDGIVEVTVNGTNYKFAPATIKVKKGDTVKLTFNNTDGIHDFVIDEFDVATAELDGGKSETVEFVADQAGSFEYYCSVGSHRQMGMKGTLVVE